MPSSMLARRCCCWSLRSMGPPSLFLNDTALPALSGSLKPRLLACALRSSLNILAQVFPRDAQTPKLAAHSSTPRSCQVSISSFASMDAEQGMQISAEQRAHLQEWAGQHAGCARRAALHGNLQLRQHCRRTSRRLSLHPTGPSCERLCSWVQIWHEWSGRHSGWLPLHSRTMIIFTVGARDKQCGLPHC